MIEKSILNGLFIFGLIAISFISGLIMNSNSCDCEIAEVEELNITQLINTIEPIRIVINPNELGKMYRIINRSDLNE